MSTPDYSALPPDLPVPKDDGAAEHLPGMRLPDRNAADVLAWLRDWR